MSTSRNTPSPWSVTWTVLAGAFAMGINFTILAVGRPAIARDLHVDATTLVWLISGPILANAIVTASAGKIGDLRGHRRVYLFGMVGATIFAGLSAVAWNGTVLVATRVLGAVVSAAIGPSGLALINLSFAPLERAKALGYWSLVAAGSPALGLVLGGPLFDVLGWRAIFWIQVPLLAIATLMAWRMLPETAKAPDTRFDIAGSVLLAAALVAFLVAVERGRTWGWTSLPTFGVFGCAVLCGVAFSRVEKSVEHPLVPLKYFRTRNFTVPIVVLFFAQFGYMGGFILAPKLLDQIGGMSTTRVSSLLVARPITFAVAGVCAGLLARRLGIRKIAVTGVLLVVASLIVMSYVATSLSEIAVVLAVAISGLGVGMSQPTIAASIANSVDDADLGVAGATQQLALQVSTSVGMNLLDALQASFAVSVALSVSYQRSYLIAAAITALGVLAAFALPARVVDGRPNDRRTRGGRSAVAPRPR